MFSSLIRQSLLVTVLSVGASAVACNANPAKDKPVAEHGEAVAANGTPASGPKYVFSAADSKLEFVGAKITGQHTGSFGNFSGVVVVEPSAIEKGSVTVNIQMDSLTADDPKLTGHLKSAEFFDTAKFPTSTFTSTSVTAGGSNGATHTVVGNLQLHGVTKSISFPATIQASGDSVSVDAEFSINRQQFGVTYPGMPDDLIKDAILLKLQIRAKKAG